MGKYVRVLIAFAMLLGLIILAKNKAASAANLFDESEKLSFSASWRSDVPCIKDKNKNKNKCGGSVLPPDDIISVCQPGNYSVGGVAILDIKNLKGDGCFSAHTRDSDPALDQFPDGSGTVLSDVIDMAFPPKGGILKICFAVPPGQQAQIYSSSGGSWAPVKTHIKDGIACAEVKNSGYYTLVSR